MDRQETAPAGGAAELRDVPPARPSRVVAASSIALVIAAAAGTAILFVREHSARASQEEGLRKEIAEGPVVRVARIEVAPADRTVSLPAEVRAEQHATLYAKVSGYVKEVRVDKGDHVQKGQVLATLESPDLEEQVRSAQAELLFRQQQAQRIERLAPSGRVSQADRDQAQEGVKVARAALNRTLVQKEYGILRAPFDGAVTARYADPGALLPAATGGTNGAQPLLEVAQLDRLRVALQLGQDDAARVRVGDVVHLQGPEPQPFEARISRIARSLDARTRTMLCEIDVPNPPAGLYPGAFVQTSLALHGPSRPLVPADALLAQKGTQFVALVEDRKVHFQRVKLGMDDGVRVEVLEGLRGGELVALDLGAEVADGSPVRVKEDVRRDGR
jgi:RND family efflux transporter MFP subunit